MTLWLPVSLGVAVLAAAADETVNLLDNPGFELVDDQGHARYWSPPGGWTPGWSQMETRDVHAGRYAFRWRWRDLSAGKSVCNFLSTVRPKMELPAPWNAGVNDTYMPCWPGVTYTISLWAKGRGEVQPFVCTSEYGLQRGTDVLAARPVTDQWQPYQWTFTTPPDLVADGAFLLLALRGREGDHMLLDDVAFACPRRDYQAHQPAKTLNATLRVRLPAGRISLHVGRTRDTRPSVASMLGTDPATADRTE